MPDIDHSIFSNPNLGKETNTPFLDEVGAQANENYHAAREGREPRKIAKTERFGEYSGLVTNGPLSFEDGQPSFPEENLDDYFTQREYERVEHQMGRDLPVEEDGEIVRPPLDIPLANVSVSEHHSEEGDQNYRPDPEESPKETEEAKDTEEINE